LCWGGSVIDSSINASSIPEIRTMAAPLISQSSTQGPFAQGNQDIPPKVFGKTYGEWSAEWVKWGYAGPKGANSIEDTTGEFCALNQPRAGVWFLAGSFGKTEVVRNCTIPANRALFYPLVESGWIDCPPPSTDSTTPAADIRKSIAEGIDGASLLTSTLDGVPISGLTSQLLTVRTQSPVFKSIVPGNNVWGNPSCVFIQDNSGNYIPDPNWIYPAGESGRQFIDGYWVMLPPLSPGLHVLKLHGAAANWQKDELGVNLYNGVSTGWSFNNEVTYNLTVLGKGS
jgi:hypothetical protein